MHAIPSPIVAILSRRENALARSERRAQRLSLSLSLSLCVLVDIGCRGRLDATGECDHSLFTAMRSVTSFLSRFIPQSSARLPARARNLTTSVRPSIRPTQIGGTFASPI